MTITLKDVAKDIENFTLEEEAQLIEVAKHDLDYKEFVYKHFTRLIVSIAKRYIRGDTVSLKDLMQQGYLGINHAIQEYKPEMSKRFSTYARWWIQAYIVEYYRENARPFTIAGSISTKLNGLVAASEKMEQELGRPPTTAELAEETDHEEGHITYLQRYLHSGTPIHLPLDADNENSSLEQMLPDNHSDSPLERLTRVDSISRVREALDILTPTEKYVLIKRYGLDGGDIWTLNEVGKSMTDLGKTKKTAEWARQVQCAAEEKLKKILSK